MVHLLKSSLLCVLCVFVVCAFCLFLLMAFDILAINNWCSKTNACYSYSTLRSFAACCCSVKVSEFSGYIDRRWYHYRLPHCHQRRRYHCHPSQQYRSTDIASAAATIIASQHVSGHILTLYNLACNNILADTLPISYLRARLLDTREAGWGGVTFHR